MTREDIIRMAREAGMERVVELRSDGTRTFELPHPDLLERFADLVAATTKEQCAQIVQSYMDEAYIGDEGWNVARDILNDIQGKK